MVVYTGHEMTFDHPDEWKAAILANPGCNTTRLVYADWLEERGFPQRAARQREIVSASLEYRAYQDSLNS